MKSKVRNPVSGFATFLKKIVINMDQHFRASNPVFDRISAAKDQTLRATYHLYGQSKWIGEQIMNMKNIYTYAVLTLAMFGMLILTYEKAMASQLAIEDSLWNEPLQFKFCGMNRQGQPLAFVSTVGCEPFNTIGATEVALIACFQTMTCFGIGVALEVLDMCKDCDPSAGWYRSLRKPCPGCKTFLHEASNQVRFCFYCDWTESDQERLARLARKTRF